MERRALYRPGVIILVLVLQFIPLLLFPASSFAPTTQEWWLPALLALMVLVAIVQLVARRSAAAWPWYLIAIEAFALASFSLLGLLGKFFESRFINRCDAIEQAIQIIQDITDLQILFEHFVQQYNRARIAPGQGMQRFDAAGIIFDQRQDLRNIVALRKFAQRFDCFNQTQACE